MESVLLSYLGCRPDLFANYPLTQLLVVFLERVGHQVTEQPLGLFAIAEVFAREDPFHSITSPRTSCPTVSIICNAVKTLPRLEENCKSPVVRKVD